MRFMGDFLKNINWKHVLIMCIGNVFAGMGIGIFKLAGLGTDPFSGMNMAVADMIGMAYGNFQLIVNIVLLIIEIAFGRRFLGIGTVVNAVCLAYITTFFYNIYTGVLGLELVAQPPHPASDTSTVPDSRSQHPHTVPPNVPAAPQAPIPKHQYKYCAADH